MFLTNKEIHWKMIMLKKNMFFFHVIVSVLIFLIMLLMQQKTEAFAQRCFLKKVFLEILQNSYESTCSRVSSLTKLQASDLQLY